MEIKMDVQVGEWPFAKQLLYRDAVKVNPQYAITEILKAISAVVEDEDDIPTSLLNLDPRWILGFCWMAERVYRPMLKFPAYVEEWTDPESYDQLVIAVQEVLLAALEEAQAEQEKADEGDHPLGESSDAEPLDSTSSDQTIPSSLPSKTDSPSVKPSIGGSETYSI